MASIVVCTPMYGGVCHGSYTDSMIELGMVLREAGHSFSFIYLSNESLIQRARNTLAWYFLNTTNASHLFFIDADLGFEAKDVLRMIDADKDIIAGIYPKKALKMETLKKALNKGLPDPEKFAGDFVYRLHEDTERVYFDQPLRMKYAGTGFMLIKRDVFTKLMPVVGTYKSNNHTADGGEVTYNFFQVPVEDDELLSEDYFFCRAFDKIGGEIYGAPWCNFSHTGSYPFIGSFVEHLKINDPKFYP
jgi:hypothetical protein